jgi:hypothetical protein
VLDPQIHRIERHEFRVGHLLSDTALQVGLNVAEEQQPRTFRVFRQFRLKVCEDVQVSVECLRDVQIVLVTTAPTKRLAVFDSLDVARVDSASLKNILLGEVAAYNGNDTDFREEAG